MFFIATTMPYRFMVGEGAMTGNPTIMQRVANPNILEIIAWFFIFTVGSSVGLS
jgi:hypothetical protein